MPFYDPELEDQMPPEAVERLKWIDAEFAKMEQRGDAADQVLEQLAETRISVWSYGREVKVTVGSDGLLADVEYSSRGLDLAMSELGPLTLSTMRRALAELQQRVEEIGEEAGGEVGAATVAEYRTGLAAQLAELDGGTDLRR